MLHHLLNLLISALIELPHVLQGNWFSLLFPLFVYLIREGRSLYESWPAMKVPLARDTKILGIVYALIFSWSIVKTVYDDHESQSFRIKTDLSKIQQQDRDNADRLSAAKDQYQLLQIECAKTQGANETMGDQNRDQQNTINNCQDRAIRTLAKLNPAISRDIQISELQNAQTMGLRFNEPTVYFIVLAINTNQPTVSSGVIHCDKPFGAGNIKLRVKHSGVESHEPTTKLKDNEYHIRIGGDSSPWTPGNPILFGITSKFESVLPCKFNLDGD